MKSSAVNIGLLTVWTLFSVLAGEKPEYREIRLSEKEPVSHIRDVEYRENPRFVPPPAAITEKAFLKDPLIDFALDPAWKARLYDCDGFLCLSKDQIARNRPNLKLELTTGGPDQLAELFHRRDGVIGIVAFPGAAVSGKHKDQTAFLRVFVGRQRQPETVTAKSDDILLFRPVLIQRAAVRKT